MDKLSQNQQQLILDFYFRCGDLKDIQAGRDLIANNPEAARLYSNLESTLTDLNHIKYDSCPDNLVDLTIARLKLMASSTKTSSHRLRQLLDKEQNAPQAVEQESFPSPSLSSSLPHKTKSGVLRPLFDLVAAAAAITIAAGILFPSFGLARQKYHQIACQYSMGALGAGLNTYSMEHQQDPDDLSSVRVQAGSAWWKIGDQGQKVRSNTRWVYPLIKEGRVKPKAFSCPGDKRANPLRLETSNITELNDFRSHQNISYSFSLLCDKRLDSLLCSKKVVASDMNPVFQKIRCDKSAYQEMDEFSKLQLNEELKQVMSANHKGRGQNLLFGDGSVRFAKSRIVNGDDIFLLAGVEVYTGCETPAKDEDIFLVP